MARINLLPWREERREERRKRFLLILIGVLAGSIGAVLIADQIITAAIERQMARNDYIGKQIAVVDERIKQISELKARRQQLVERMRIIQDLQGNRQISGRVFDQLARTLPDGVYFTDVKMSNSLIVITGTAQSPSLVAELMRNLDASHWLEAPVLIDVKAEAAPAGGQERWFQMTVGQTHHPVHAGGQL